MNKSEERLIELLEEKNFKGMDASIEESLFCYGIVRREKDGFTILCIGDESAPYKFGVTTIEVNDIKEAIKEMKNGFFEWVGSTADEYINQFNNDVKSNLVRYIYDIRVYEDRLTHDVYLTLTADEIISILTSN